MHPQDFVCKALHECVLDEADKTLDEQEVPIASLIYSLEDSEQKILAIAKNSILKTCDATAHSEMQVIQEMCKKKSYERLYSYALVTTLEPCLMCSGAIILARLGAVYYFAPTEKGIGLSQILQTFPKELNHYPKAIHLEKEEKEYRQTLSHFFTKRRAIKKRTLH